MLAKGVNTVYTQGMAEKYEDATMTRIRDWFKASGLSLQELGLKMGCEAETARQSAWQFMRTGDPHISMLRRFAAAAGMTIEELVGEKKQRKKPS